ncbi:MAG: YihY/virulence factor BrkB family protein [Bacteroidota bacterium]
MPSEPRYYANEHYDLDTFNAFWKRTFVLMGKKDLFFNASAITFNLILCSIPFTLIMISIIGYVLSVDQAFDEIVRYGQEFFPNFSFEFNNKDIFRGEDTIHSLLNPLIGARRIVGITGFIILMFFTQGLIHSLKHVMFDAFEIEDRKHPVMDAVYNFLAFGVLGSVFLFFSLVIFTLDFFDFSEIAIPYTDIVIRLGWVYRVLDIVLPIALMFLVQYAIFRFVSERKLSPKVALFGAFAYTVLFEIAKFIVSNYMEVAFSAYRNFYQGYALLIVIAAWTFYCSLLFVLAAVMARAYKEVVLPETQSVTENPYTEIS